ncbi:outer membrane lipoprotein chaperone LolA [Perlucidibaca piscinae]|uniref:outer membrane lipoprotein chaperone LolA n=1 Tax=Perlucidibaca piscinae TaxID=392589 RepID=UPI0003B78669|nr:outer membrane lipoprotein chaperone LolA [Perlucidibaca piscinae]
MNADFTLFRRVSLIAVLAIALPAAAHAAAADASAALAQRLKSLNTFQADFTQTSQQTGKAPTVVTGSLSLSKPGLFRWAVHQPYQQLIVSDGKEVRVHDPDLMQMTIRPLGKDMGQTPALLLSGDAKLLQQQFRVSEKKRLLQTEYQLTPRAKDALFASVSLQFKGKTPTVMRLKDSLGQQTLIEFRNLRLNTTLAPSLFRFEPPKGTDIIRE